MSKVGFKSGDELAGEIEELGAENEKLRVENGLLRTELKELQGENLELISVLQSFANLVVGSRDLVTRMRERGRKVMARFSAEGMRL